MRKPINHPGGLISAPPDYLQNCSSGAWRLVDSFHMDSRDFGLRQLEYETHSGKPCPNCTPTALVNALGHYRARFPAIPDDPHACYALLRTHMRLVQTGIPTLGGYPFLLEPVLARRLWRLLGVDAWPALYPLPDARTLRRQSERGAPLVLSLWSQAYRSHTVLLLGWELWTDGRAPRLFWCIRDGWAGGLRYLDADACLILQALRLAR